MKADDMTLENLVMTYLYPRIDANVSTGINHLLKSPWCVHPKTGKICVPINPNRPDDFKCNDVPTLTQVIRELGTIGKDAESHKEEGETVTPPVLRPYMVIFKDFLKGIQKSQVSEQQKQGKAAAASAGNNNIDF